VTTANSPEQGGPQSDPGVPPSSAPPGGQSPSGPSPSPGPASTPPYAAPPPPPQGQPVPPDAPPPGGPNYYPGPPPAPGAPPPYVPPGTTPPYAPPFPPAGYPPAGYPPAGYPPDPASYGPPGIPGVPPLPPGVTLAPVGRRIGAYFLSFVLLIVTLVIGYIIWGLVVWGRGTTPALSVLKMRCLKADTGAKATFGTMALRDIVGRILEGILSWITLLISLILFLTRPDRRCIHDLVGGTIVVYDPEGRLNP
jgi:uncharacterized RDD family membrane protein YckC